MARHAGASGSSDIAKAPVLDAEVAAVARGEVGGQRRRFRDGRGRYGRSAQNEAEHGGEEGAGRGEHGGEVRVAWVCGFAGG